MGWSVGYDPNWHRDIGYGVPAKCDHPECDEDIDRGLSYVCGDDVFGGDHGCGLFFCDAHLGWSYDDEGNDRLDQNGDCFPWRCDPCMEGMPPFTPKPDVPLWIEHKLSDPSWQQWRNENPSEVAALANQEEV